jgi:type IV pilus assembly protein PilV
MARTLRPRAKERGFSLLEVLIAMLIVMVGLLGLAGMQARAQVAELESYQRAQALVLLYDMVDRINNNRFTAPCFAITTNTTTGAPFFGDPANPVTPVCAVDTAANNAQAVAEMTAWDQLLQGAAEQKGATAVGAMIGARGCISYNASTEYLSAATGGPIQGTGEYTIAVSWQGMANTFQPVKACGAGLYGSASSSNDTMRRTVWATMRVATLAAQ